MESSIHQACALFLIALLLKGTTRSCVSGNWVCEAKTKGRLTLMLLGGMFAHLWETEI